MPRISLTGNPPGARALRGALAGAALIALLASPSPAAAIGSYCHVHISQVAAEVLPEGELRDLLGALPDELEAGSMFPDSGYAINDDYGELAHWPEFHNAYIAFLREKYAGDFASDEARAEVAFLLGDMSHGLADQVYDYTLMARGLEVDDEGERSPDELVDYFVVVDHGVLLDTRAWGPYDDVAVVMGRAGYDVAPETLSRGQGAMAAVLFVQRTVARGRYLEAWNTYPWIGTHIYDPAAWGSIPHLGRAIAAHWQAVWRRLQGTATMDTDLVTFTVPENGAVNFPVDAESDGVAWFRVGVVLSYGVRRAQAAPFVSLRDPQGEPVAVRLRSPYNRSVNNYLMLEPLQPLAYDTEYTVTVAPGVENLDGQANTVPYAFSFRTRCAPDHLDDCPPLADPLVTGEIPTEVPPVDPPVAEPVPDAGSTADAGDGADTVDGGATADGTDGLGADGLDADGLDADGLGHDASAPDDAGVLDVPGADVPGTDSADGAGADGADGAGAGADGRGGGCAAAATPSAPGWPTIALLLLALALVARRLRRRSAAAAHGPSRIDHPQPPTNGPRVGLSVSRPVPGRGVAAWTISSRVSSRTPLSR